MGEPDEDGWLTAQVAALHGYLFDPSEHDVLDQADEISALILAIVARLHRDGDTVLGWKSSNVSAATSTSSSWPWPACSVVSQHPRRADCAGPSTSSAG